MGGILSAEVALLSSPASDISGARQFRHRILGTISFDCPFLGLHPGIVFSGIGSLFRPAPTSPGIQVPQLDSDDQVLELHPKNSPKASSSPLRTPLPLSRTGPKAQPGSNAPLVVGKDFPAGVSEGSRTQGSSGKDSSSIYSTPSDPYYDPPFPNDIRLPERKGWDSTLHFVTKHSHDLAKAATAYVTSHLEFGACVADYKGLQNRYMKLRPLEDIEIPDEGPRRIRFLNYYTICNGRPKKPKPVAEGGHGLYSATADAQTTALQCSEYHPQGLQNLSSSTLTTQSPTPSPRISVEEHLDGEVHPKTIEDFEELQLLGEENRILDERVVMSKDSSAENATDGPGSLLSAHERANGLEPSSALNLTTPDDSYQLPPLPSLPEAPQRYDPAAYSDPKSRNLAYRQYSAEFKSYMRALKVYDQAIRDRLKSIEKQEKENEKSKKSSKPPGGKKLQPSTISAIFNSAPERDPASSSFPVKRPSEGGDRLTPQTEKKIQKERRFCILPPRINGQRDECWVRIFMKDVDEVGAHCGLFVLGDHYEWLVNDVGTRIRGWVEEI